MQYAGGSFRFAVRGQGGRLVTWSEGVDYTQLDNTAAPFTVYEYADSPRHYGTINDVHITTPRDMVVHGQAGETLEVQIYHTAKITTVNSASCTVHIRVTEIYQNPITKRPENSPRTLYVGDRLNGSGDTGGIHDANGLPDGTLNIANDWSTLMRFRPRFGTNWIMEGISDFTLDGA